LDQCRGGNGVDPGAEVVGESAVTIKDLRHATDANAPALVSTSADNLEVVGSTPYPCCQVNDPGMALILSKVQSPHQIQGGSSHH
jgi:hypothetical protein